MNWEGEDKRKKNVGELWSLEACRIRFMIDLIYGVFISLQNFKQWLGEIAARRQRSSTRSLRHILSGCKKSLCPVLKCLAAVIEADL